MIDWSLAERIAGYVAGEPPRGALAPRLAPAPLRDLAGRCEDLVTGYTRMRPAGPIPIPETIGRGAWTRANLRSARPMLDPVTVKFAGGAGPFAPAVRALAAPHKGRIERLAPVGKAGASRRQVTEPRGGPFYLRDLAPQTHVPSLMEPPPRAQPPPRGQDSRLVLSRQRHGLRFFPDAFSSDTWP